MAPLQKRALYSLLIGLAMATAMAVLFVIKGVAAFDEDDGFRYIVYGLWVGVPLVCLILMKITLRKPTQIDERDRLITESASKTQLWGVIFTIVAWIVVLTEVFYEAGQVPIIYLTLIFISTLIISTLAQLLGILYGYWRS